MYIGTMINDSPTIVRPAGAAINKGAFLAAKLNGSGALVPCATLGEMPAGIILADANESITLGEDVTVQIKDIGKWRAGAAFAAGAALTTNAAGKAVTATTGNMILGYALEAASGVDAIVSVQITKSGAAT